MVRFRRLSFPVCCVVLMIFLLCIDAFIYCSRLGCRTKIDANVIASPFDRSPAPPMFASRKSIKVKDLAKTLVKLNLKPRGAASAGETFGARSVKDERVWSDSEHGYRSRRHKRYRYATYTADNGNWRHASTRPSLRQRERPLKQRSRPSTADGSVDAAFVPVEPGAGTNKSE